MGEVPLHGLGFHSKPRTLNFSQGFLFALSDPGTEVPRSPDTAPPHRRRAQGYLPHKATSPPRTLQYGSPKSIIPLGPFSL